MSTPLPATITQVLVVVVGAGGVGGAIKIIGQLTRIAVAIETLVKWRDDVDKQLHEHQTRLDKGGL